MPGCRRTCWPKRCSQRAICIRVCPRFGQRVTTASCREALDSPADTRARKRTKAHQSGWEPNRPAPTCQHRQRRSYRSEYHLLYHPLPLTANRLPQLHSHHPHYDLLFSCSSRTPSSLDPRQAAPPRVIVIGDIRCTSSWIIRGHLCPSSANSPSTVRILRLRSCRVFGPPRRRRSATACLGPSVACPSWTSHGLTWRAAPG